MPRCRGGRSNFASCLRRSLVDTYPITRLRCMSTPRWKAVGGSQARAVWRRAAELPHRSGEERSFSARAVMASYGATTGNRTRIPGLARRDSTVEPSSQLERAAGFAPAPQGLEGLHATLATCPQSIIGISGPVGNRTPISTVQAWHLPVGRPALEQARFRARRAECWWTRWGLEPQSPQCESGVFPLDDRPRLVVVGMQLLAGREGIEPSRAGVGSPVAAMAYAPRVDS
jgi:hypothetical protein